MHAVKRSKLPFHYGWVIVCTGLLCIFASLGFGRFAIGMLLPSMASTLKLSYAQIGFISTGNFVGYLTAVFISHYFDSKLGSRKLISCALLIIGATMVLISKASGFRSILILYTITGMGSGASNVPMMGLISKWFDSSVRGKAAGFIVIGSGFAIIFSGKLIPYINAMRGPEGWRTSWSILSIIVIVIAALCMLLLRDSPEEKGIHPVSGKTANTVTTSQVLIGTRNIYKNKTIYLLGLIYFIFGYTYVIYATFIVTTLVNEKGFTEMSAGTFWSWVGILSLLSGPVFGTLSDKFGRKRGLIIVFSLQMLSYILVALKLPLVFLYLSIGFYGIVAWSIPSIMLATVCDYVEPEKAIAAFGFITFIFGFGQISGPAIAGVLAETTGSFSSSFLMAAAFVAIAIFLVSMLKRPQTVEA